MNRILFLSLAVAVNVVFLSPGRTCLAQSNVQAWLDGNSTLHIVGDENGVSIKLTVLARQIIQVDGFEGFNTTVNGSDKGQKFAKVRSIDIQLGDTDDLVYVDGKDQPRTIDGTFNVVAGFGDDKIGFKDFYGGGDINIAMGGFGIKVASDDDYFYASGFSGSSDLELTTGPGSDEIDFDVANGTGRNNFAGITTIDTGSGTSDSDNVSLWQFDGQLELTTSDGDDTINIVDSRCMHLQQIQAGGGDDVVELEGLISFSWMSGGFGGIHIDLGSGTNDLSVLGAYAEGDLTVYSGGGADTVLLDACDIYNLLVALKAGNDTLIFIDSHTEISRLYGDRGKDALYHSNSTFDGYPEYSGWETIRGF